MRYRYANGDARTFHTDIWEAPAAAYTHKVEAQVLHIPVRIWLLCVWVKRLNRLNYGQDSGNEPTASRPWGEAFNPLLPMLA